MSIEPFEVPQPIARQIEMPPLAVDSPQLENVQGTLLSQEQARAAAQAFAQRHQGQDTFGGLVGLASAGMLLHDLVTDTLAEPEKEETEEEEEDGNKV
jgi:hypothetical protein